MPAQVGLIIITCGLYAIYWFYQTAMEMTAIAGDKEASPVLWTILLFIPFGAFFSYYKYGELYEKITQGQFNMWLIFILWLVFSPAVWFIVQMDLNKRAEGMAAKN